MLAKLRARVWQRAGVWIRAVGLGLLLVAFFAPLPAAALLTILAVGLVLFFIGALVWFAQDSEPWFRP